MAEVIQVLLDAGADIRLANEEGQTALDLARLRRVTPAIRLLRARKRFLNRLAFIKPAAAVLEPTSEA
eukprot:m.670045 g.670045  ORF g.670045 m.670045 type:complete len:68 (+) comp58526_c0_seq9:1962-2165(+)